LTANAPSKETDTLSLYNKATEANRPIFASPKPRPVHSLDPTVERNKAIDHQAHDHIFASPKPVPAPVPPHKPLVDNANIHTNIRTPLANDHHPHPSTRWSPFVFRTQFEFDSETSDVQLQTQTTEFEMNEGLSTTGDDDCQSSDISLDLTPLNLDDDDNSLLRKDDADALLSFLIDDNDITRPVESVSHGWTKTTYDMACTAVQATPGSFTYSESIDRSWADRYPSMKTQIQPTPSFSDSALTTKDLVGSPSPMFSRFPMSRNIDQSLQGESAARLDTPPSKLITEKEKFSAISTLTRGSKSRKKARLSPQEKQDPSLPYDKFNAFSPKTPSMPSLETAELDICWTDTKPYFRVGFVNNEEVLHTPARKSVNNDENLYQVLSSRGSRSDQHKRSAFATTPHFPNTLLKVFHSEPNRQINPYSRVLDAPIQALTELRPRQLPSPPQDALKTHEMNRVLFGIESPTTSEY